MYCHRNCSKMLTYPTEEPGSTKTNILTARCLMLAASAEKGKAWSGGKSSCPLMLKFGYIVLAVSLFALVVHVHASAYRPAAGSSQDLVAERPSGKRMDPFKKVLICAPFNVKIVPGADYKVTITADEVVKDAISTNVHQETLTLEAMRNFRTSKPIQVTVSLPVAVGAQQGSKDKCCRWSRLQCAPLHRRACRRRQPLLDGLKC